MVGIQPPYHASQYALPDTPCTYAVLHQRVYPDGQWWVCRDEALGSPLGIVWAMRRIELLVLPKV